MVYLQHAGKKLLLLSLVVDLLCVFLPLLSLLVLLLATFISSLCFQCLVPMLF